MRVIKWLLRESTFKFLLATLAGVAGGLLTIGVLVLLFRFIGRSEETKLELFLFMSAGAIGCRALSRILVGSIGGNAIFSLRLELFRRIVTAPLVDIERVGRSRLMVALTDDIGRIAAIVPNLVVLCTNFTLLLAYLAYLGWLSTTQLGIILAVIVVGITCHLMLRREGTKQTRISWQTRNDLLEVFRSAIDGAKELKLNSSRREHALQGFVKRANELQASAKRQELFFGGSTLAAQTLFYVALGLVMFSFAGANADQQLVASYGIAVVYLMGPLQSSIEIVQGLAEADVALDRVEELGLTLEKAQVRQKSESSKDSHATSSAIECRSEEFRDLELSGVVHSYISDVRDGEREFVLGPVDLTLVRGEILFVVGGNGSGKTTLAKILAGLYLPATGSIRVNGHVVSGADTEWYCQFFSAVFHDFFVFDHFLGDGEWSDDLLRRFKMDGRIQIENNRVLKSSALSLGERKRLALIFACLDDKPIIIFDEWAADQDPEFKEFFYKEVLRELRARGKLVIVISHDDRYFQFADKILVLERGKPPLQRVIESSSTECT